MELAKQAGAAAGLKAGHLAGTNAVIEQLRTLGIYFVGDKLLESLIDPQNYTNFSTISSIISKRNSELCSINAHSRFNDMCTQLKISLRIVKSDGISADLPDTNAIRLKAQEILTEAKGAAAEVTNTATEKAIATLTAKNTGEVNATYMGYQTPIIASIVAILVIVLIMVIIYLILRYRRKRKMKKKLQYIKLLEE
ncbi:hypothetical protein PFDG_03036 [Plasmodium falciparum Dd2]|nr:hypothetical protein PFDG_03036 [Plasmodium falciparum Dd2]